MDKWKDKLKDLIPRDLEEEISIFETQIELMRRGEIDDRIFAETRLRRGVYGQRYDNGQRHDGNRIRKLEYPSIDEGLAGRLEKAGINIAFGSFSYGLGSLAKGITGNRNVRNTNNPIQIVDLKNIFFLVI